MTTSLSEPLLWKGVASLLGVGAAAWRLRRFRRNVEDRQDIVSDGWVTRWTEVAEYQTEQERLRRRYHGEIVTLAILGFFEIAVWALL